MSNEFHKGMMVATDARLVALLTHVDNATLLMALVISPYQVVHKIASLLSDDGLSAFERDMKYVSEQVNQGEIQHFSCECAQQSVLGILERLVIPGGQAMHDQ